jgi:hypothetical protein
MNANLSLVVKKLLGNIDRTSEILDKLRKESNVENIIVEKILELPDEFLYNSSISQLIAHILLLLDKKEHIKQFSLDEIKTLYRDNLKLNRFNLDFHEDYIFLLNSVYDDSASAKKYAQEAIEIAREKIEKFENIIAEIDSLP